MMDWKTILITAAIILVVLIAIGCYFKIQKNKRSGIKGEKKVAGILKRFAGIREYKVINDIYLPLYDKTTQIDHILIGFFGMIVVETKNYKGDVYGDPKSKDWLHVVGSDRNRFYNPIMQNQTHIDAIRHIFAKENIYKINIDSMVVFTGGRKSHLYVPSNTPIYKLRQFKRQLHKSMYEKDRDVDVELLYQTLMNHRVTDPKLIAQHNKNVKKMAKAHQ